VVIFGSEADLIVISGAAPAGARLRNYVRKR